MLWCDLIFYGKNVFFNKLVLLCGNLDRVVERRGFDLSFNWSRVGYEWFLWRNVESIFVF